MYVVAPIDVNTNQAYLLGYLLCSQLSTPRRVRFYIDSGSTITTLLSIDIVRLNLRWSNLTQTDCDTAIGPAKPYELPSVTILLKTIVDEQGTEQLIPHSLDKINLLPPDDPCDVVPAQYEFAFSLLGMDILKEFTRWEWNFTKNQLILK